MIDQNTLKSLSATFAKFQSEVAAKDIYIKQRDEAQAALDAADASLRSHLSVFGWDGTTPPETFLHEISQKVVDVVSQLEQLGQPQPPQAPFSPNNLFPSFAPPPGTR